MHFVAQIMETGIRLDRTYGVTKVMLSNGRQKFLRTATYDSSGHCIVPGDLVEFDGGHDVDLEGDQKPGTYHQLYSNWCLRVTDEVTIRTFFHGAAILGSTMSKNKNPIRKVRRKPKT